MQHEYTGNGELRTFEFVPDAAAFTLVLADIVLSAPRDFVYKKCETQDNEFGWCMYVHKPETDEECPGCLIGQVLIRLGVPMGWFTDGRNRQTAGLVMRELGYHHYDDDTIKRASYAQAAQDAGVDWRVVLNCYLRNEDAFPNF